MQSWNVAVTNQVEVYLLCDPRWSYVTQSQKQHLEYIVIKWPKQLVKQTDTEPRTNSQSKETESGRKSNNTGNIHNPMNHNGYAQLHVDHILRCN